MPSPEPMVEFSPLIENTTAKAQLIHGCKHSSNAIPSDAACDAMAKTVVPVINMGLVEIQRQAKAS